ncbi:MAG: glycosyltransferase family 4 protein [Gammaproteobacteria bacterium]|nr:glycosyltransferase family 4 protein [Gammaproteobacteria bacterium]
MKVAVVHDWLVTYAGAERVLEQILTCYPEADLFAVVDFFNDEQRSKYLMGKKANTTFIQKLPFAKTKYRAYLSLMPLAIEQLDLSKYDLVISSSHAVAKGVITGPDQLHISYVHSPMRYAWDLQHQYLKESGLEKGVRSFFARRILHKMRIWDLRTANGVDFFIANSNYIAKRIWKVYRREAKVIYPPVLSSACVKSTKPKEDFYLTASRLVPYKKIDLIVKVFAKMPDKKLIVIGDGPQMKIIKKIASRNQNITLMGYQDSAVVLDFMQRAKAFIFAGEEDFGIVNVEAQGCGTPVIAYGKGGGLETINSINSASPTGLFFYEQTEEALIVAINKFAHIKFNPDFCYANAEKFSQEVFIKEFRAFVDMAVAKKFGAEAAKSDK